MGEGEGSIRCDYISDCRVHRRDEGSNHNQCCSHKETALWLEKRRKKKRDLIGLLGKNQTLHPLLQTP